MYHVVKIPSCAVFGPNCIMIAVFKLLGGRMFQEFSRLLLFDRFNAWFYLDGAR